MVEEHSSVISEFHEDLLGVSGVIAVRIGEERRFKSPLLQLLVGVHNLMALLGLRTCVEAGMTPRVVANRVPLARPRA